jgi:ABC-type lipoprotein release transport system permease subunit
MQRPGSRSRCCPCGIESLLLQVKGTEAASLIVPVLVLFAAAVVAALPTAISAVRIDPVEMLRSE